MTVEDSSLTTGLPGLDHVLGHLIPGDNVVWEVDDIEDYIACVRPYAEAAAHSGRRFIYFRFAEHRPVVPESCAAEVHQISPGEGFETFIARIHSVIEEAGRGALYVFDCLSELVADWYSEQMLGNFFVLTCPYLFDLETITYFALFRARHSIHSLGPIMSTTQLYIEVYGHKQRLYIRPRKVLHRYSDTMNMFHAWGNDDQFKPITSSMLVSEIMSATTWAGPHTSRAPGFLNREFLAAQNLLSSIETGEADAEDEAACFARLVRMIVSRDDAMVSLVSKYMSLKDLLEIRHRMIGTGLIGGKTVGMLLARAVLLKRDKRLGSLLETHDSFYVGSDVFYTFLVQNGVWWDRQRQRDPKNFLVGAERARRLILTGTLPDYILAQLSDMLDYFGQAPFIVRSSSLLEDNFGNAFAGKYDSVFCANQGPRDRRMEALLAAIRTIYASTMSERALRYRSDRDMLDRDEQMALLVMRVSGDMHARKYYPTMAGVGFSFNPFAWNEHIDPKAGVLRLVFGLGTRAVDRSDDDYTRLVALNAPNRRPEHGFDEVRQYAQRRVDFIDVDANRLTSGHFLDVIRDSTGLPLNLLTSVDRTSRDHKTRILTFDRLLAGTDFVADMRAILALLQSAYDYPVDIEFTVNFGEGDRYCINLVQCRPLQVQGSQAVKLPKVSIDPEDRIIESRGAVVGQSRVVAIERFVYVKPDAYGALTRGKRYEIARLLGQINRTVSAAEAPTTMLLGPGRWGTSSPSLGIPVTFHDISHVSVLCEIVTMREGLVPDVSLGTHFLNELVEMDMLYLAIFPKQGENYLNSDFFETAPNRLMELVPGATEWTGTVWVVEARDMPKERGAITLTADSFEQRVQCYFARPALSAEPGAPSPTR